MKELKIIASFFAITFAFFLGTVIILMLIGPEWEGSNETNRLIFNINQTLGLLICMVASALVLILHAIYKQLKEIKALMDKSKD